MITVYEKPTCTKCREMNRFLQDNGVDFSKVNYYIEPLTKEKLKELLGKMKMKPRDLLRTSEPIYRELGLRKGEFTDDEIISLMVKHPGSDSTPDRRTRQPRRPGPAHRKRESIVVVSEALGAV